MECTGGTGQAQEKCIRSAGWLPDQGKGTCWRLEKGRGVGLRGPLARGEPACRAPHATPPPERHRKPLRRGNRQAVQSGRQLDVWKKIGKLWEVGGGGPPGCWLVRRDERPQGKKLERWWGAKNLDENGLFSSASEEKRRVSSTFLLLERRAGDSGCWA